MDVWTEKITPQLFKNTTTSKSSFHASPTSSLSYQSWLTENDKNLLSSIHQNINHKWVLSSGTVVEDAIYKYSKDFKVEHIDDQLNSMFTADKIKEIEKESGFTDMSKSLPESLVNILMKLKGKSNFKSIDQTFQEMRYDRRIRPVEYWCRNSILNYLDLFIESNNFTPFVTEQNLLNDMYGFLKSIKNISRTTTKTNCQSNASNSNKNSQRELDANQKLVRQAKGDCSDLTFKYLSSELGCV